MLSKLVTEPQNISGVDIKASFGLPPGGLLEAARAGSVQVALLSENYEKGLPIDYEDVKYMSQERATDFLRAILLNMEMMGLLASPEVLNKLTPPVPLSSKFVTYALGMLLGGVSGATGMFFLLTVTHFFHSCGSAVAGGR